MKYTNIFIDLDDTLIDTKGNTRETLKEIYKEYNINEFYPTFDEFFLSYSTYNDYLWDLFSQNKIEKPRLLKERFYHLFKDEKEVDHDFIDKMNKDFLDRVERKSGLVDDAIDFLDYLKEKFERLHMISNGFTDTQNLKVKSAGLNGYFDQKIYSDSIGVSKPSPEIYKFAMEQVGAMPENSIMIGDNIITDIKGALGVGMDTIWFNPDNADKGDVEPTFTITELMQVIDIL